MKFLGYQSRAGIARFTEWGAVDLALRCRRMALAVDFGESG